MKPKPLNQAERQSVWSKISANLGKQKSPGFRPFLPLPRYAAVAIALLVVIIGGSLAAAAAADSAKPGDPLFGVDLAAERVRLAFAFKAETKDRLRVAFAEERLVEAETVVAVASEVTVATESATSTATSSESATTTPSEKRRIEAANHALEVALGELEKTRTRLAEEGNETAVLAIDIIIENLKKLADEHLARLEKFAARVRDNGGNVRVEIRAANDELRAKLKLELRDRQDDDEDDEDEDELEDRRERIDKKVEELRERIKERRDRFDDHIDKLLDRFEDKVIVCHQTEGERDVTIRISRSALKAHLDHGDRAGECEDEDHDEDEDEERPDETAPKIAGIGVHDVASTTAIVRWETNEPADSIVWYSSTTPLAVTDATLRVTRPDRVRDHQVRLEGLTASTTYYFIVGSADAAGNIATSSEHSFRTR